MIICTVVVALLWWLLWLSRRCGSATATLLHCDNHRGFRAVRHCSFGATITVVFAWWVSPTLYIATTTGFSAWWLSPTLLYCVYSVVIANVRQPLRFSRGGCHRRSFSATTTRVVANAPTLRQPQGLSRGGCRVVVVGMMTMIPCAHL